MKSLAMVRQRRQMGLEGDTKRDIQMILVDKVICWKEGVDVHFVPGLFDEDTGGEGTIYSTFSLGE